MADISRLTTERSRRAMEGTRLELVVVLDKDMLHAGRLFAPAPLGWRQVCVAEAGGRAKDSNALDGIAPAVALALLRKGGEDGRP